MTAYLIVLSVAIFSFAALGLLSGFIIGATLTYRHVHRIYGLEITPLGNLLSCQQIDNQKEAS